MGLGAPALLSEDHSPRSLGDQKTVISKLRPDGQPEVARAGKAKDAARLLEGEQLGHFLLEQYVGGGGMGVVFRALDTMLGRTVAVKVVSNDTTDEETLRRFRNEAQSAARLDHPNIARVHYVGEDKGWDYIVFEYIEGDNVRDLVERSGPLPLDQAISYTLQVAEALAHASQRDVVHRDIKPSNILVMPDGRAKLVDMGLARLHQVEAPSNDLTATGVTLGTFDYISPEQARDPRTADVRSDLYSLGCTFHYMLTGSAPFPEGTVLQKLLSHSSEPPPDPRDVRPDLPEEVSAISLKLMSKQPSQRFQHPHELVGALLLLAERLGLPTSARGGTVWITTHESWGEKIERQLPWLVPVLLLVAAVFAVEWCLPSRPITRLDMLPKRVALPDRETERAASVVSPSRGEESLTALPKGVTAEPSAGLAREEATQPLAAPADAGGEEGTLNGSGEPETQVQVPTQSEGVTTVGNGSQVTSGEIAAERSFAVSPADTAGAKVPADRPFDGTFADISSGNTSAGIAENAPAKFETTAPSHVLTVKPGKLQNGEANTVSSLAAAFQRWAESPDINTIELHFDTWEESPLVLELPSERGELTVKAAAGYTPLIVFRPAASLLDSHRQIFDLKGGRIAFEGVHLAVVLPYGSPETWSLFALRQVSDVRFTRCTLTLRNPDRAPAAFFAVQGVSSWDAAGRDEEPMVATTPKISLEASVVRGQASLIRATEGVPFRLEWQQGFLATSECLAESEGLADYTLSDVIRISLAHVTAAVDQGLFRLRIHQTAPVLPEVAIRCENCVFVQSRSVPLIEYRGVDSVEQATAMFEMDGKDNFYDFTEIRWRIVPTDETTKDFRWEEQAHNWYLERRADRGLRWRDSVLAPSQDVSQRTPQEYLLDPSDSRLAGFDETQLPLPPSMGPTSHSRD